MPKSISSKMPAILLALAFVISVALKMINIKVGAPFVTIDDNTTFEGGFLVWFGNVPPQRMYLESWIAGIVSMSTYLLKTGLSGAGIAAPNLNLVADAFRDYYGAPDPYVLAYRWVMLAVDMATAWLVYLTARLVLKDRWQGMGAVLVAVMFLFSYNTIWCNLVARPDTMTAFFGIAGLYFYFKSDFGNDTPRFWISAALLGCAAGMKLHGAFFAIFLVFDLVRIHGILPGLRKTLPLVLISLLFFGFSAGIPLFDPLKYVKLRMLNYRDDLSPWITWGGHFVTLFRGTGWVVIPLILFAAWRLFTGERNPEQRGVKSVLLLAVCWLLLFAAIRPLRAYWMLPALALFYMSAVYALSTIKPQRLGGLAAAVLIAILGYQSVHQVLAFRGVDYNGLRHWVVENVKPDEPIYIFGYEALNLPKTTKCISNIRAGIERMLEEDLQQGLSFTLRHLKNWEEHSALALFDMLEYRFDGGHTYYGFHTNPSDKFQGIIALDEMKYIFIQEHFSMESAPGMADYLDERFSFLTQKTGPGGGGRGLSYRIYKRNALES